VPPAQPANNAAYSFFAELEAGQRRISWQVMLVKLRLGVARLFTSYSR